MKTANTIVMGMTLLCSMLLTACVYDNVEPAGKEADTYLHLSFASADTRTRAVSDLHEGQTEENTITSLRVWAFDSDNADESAIALCYNEETAITGATTGRYTLTMKVPRKTGGRELKHIDLYILANAESGTNLVTANINRTMTRAWLKDVCLTESFGVDSEGTAQCTTVPAKGLPMGRIVERIAIENYRSEDQNATSPSIDIPLTRAVSKLHFFFARRTNGATEQVEVTGIDVAEGVVPDPGSYVFPLPVPFSTTLPDAQETRTYNKFVAYPVNKRETLTATNIVSVDDPETLKRGVAENADAYVARLAQAGMKGHYLTYLRETDRAVPVTVRYRLTNGGTEKSVTVNVQAGDMRRNHEVLIYGYFLESGMLAIEPQVLDWVNGGEYDFNSVRTLTLTHEVAYEVTPEGESESRVAIAWHDADDSRRLAQGSAPAHAPLITFKDVKTSAHHWILQTDNPLFGFVLKGGTEIVDHIDGYDGTVEFYFVPRRNYQTSSSVASRKATIFMTLPDEDNSRVVINAGDEKMTGREDEITFYQVTPETYTSLKNGK